MCKWASAAYCIEREVHDLYLLDLDVSGHAQELVPSQLAQLLSSKERRKPWSRRKPAKASGSPLVWQARAKWCIIAQIHAVSTEALLILASIAGTTSRSLAISLGRDRPC